MKKKIIIYLSLFSSFAFPVNHHPCEATTKISGKEECQKLISTCSDFPMKWVPASSCSNLAPIMYDGCFCESYCGYTCQEGCLSDMMCSWDVENQVCKNIETGLAGSLSIVKTCPKKHQTTIEVARNTASCGGKRCTGVKKTPRPSLFPTSRPTDLKCEGIFELPSLLHVPPTSLSISEHSIYLKEPSPCALGLRAVRYSFKAPQSGFYSFETVSDSSKGTCFDTVLTLSNYHCQYSAIYEAIKCNDDISPPNYLSQVVQYLSASQRVVILVSTWADNCNGNISMKVDRLDLEKPLDTVRFNIDYLHVSNFSRPLLRMLEQAKNRWQEIIPKDTNSAYLVDIGVTCNGIRFDKPFLVDDLLVLTFLKDVDGPGNVLASAGLCAIDPRTNRPSMGFLQIDTSDIEEYSSILSDIILHELGHLLGIGSLWENRQLLSPNSNSGPFYYLGTNGILGFHQVKGVGNPLVDSTGRPGTRRAHFDETQFGNELMTGYLNFEKNPLSKMSIRSLQDLGYVVDVKKADSYTLPKRSSSLRRLQERKVHLDNDVIMFSQDSVISTKENYFQKSMFTP